MAVEGKTENPPKWHTASRKIGKRNGLSSPHRLFLHASPVEASLLSPPDLDPHAARSSWLGPDGWERERFSEDERDLVGERDRGYVWVRRRVSRGSRLLETYFSRPMGRLKLWVILPKRPPGVLDVNRVTRKSSEQLEKGYFNYLSLLRERPIGDRDKTICLD